MIFFTKENFLGILRSCTKSFRYFKQDFNKFPNKNLTYYIKCVTQNGYLKFLQPEKSAAEFSRKVSKNRKMG
jgi:hypothetical protein